MSLVTEPIRVGFDIGGVISKFPSHMKALIVTLSESSLFEVFIITDMPRETALRLLFENQVMFHKDNLLCADWNCHGDMCKAVLAKKHRIDILLDDYPGYIAEGVPIGLLLMPRPRLPYNSNEWKSS